MDLGGGQEGGPCRGRTVVTLQLPRTGQWVPRARRSHTRAHVTLSCPPPTLPAFRGLPPRRWGGEEVVALRSPSGKGTELGKEVVWGVGARLPLKERKPGSCLWKPGILRAGMAGPARG